MRRTERRSGSPSCARMRQGLPSLGFDSAVQRLPLGPSRHVTRLNRCIPACESIHSRGTMAATNSLILRGAQVASNPVTPLPQLAPNPRS
jgi:hypothetical protein